MANPTNKSKSRALPGRLQVVADVAGREVALAIAREFGGRRLYLPALSTLRQRRAHPLVNLLGFECALKVVEAISGFGEYFEVPAARSELLDAKIREGLSRGLSASALAQEAGISRRAVFYRIAAIRAEQGSRPARARKRRTGRQS